MARDDQHWDQQRSRFGGEQDKDRETRDRDIRDREMRDRNPQQGFSRPRDWGNPQEYHGNRGEHRGAPGGYEQDRSNRSERGQHGDSGSWSGRTGGAWGGSNRGGETEGGWDEGQPGGGQYGQGMYDQRLGSQGQEGYSAGRGSWGEQGWGQYSRESNRGSDLGRARNSYGNTGGDNYGGGGVGGYQGNWGQGQQGHQSQQGSSVQSHVGRGPRGWKRSDERIREDVNEQLERHPQIDASDIEVHVEDGEVTLSGHVSDRRTKRLAEDVVEGVSGVREVQNQIRVKREDGVLSQLFGGGGDRDREQDRNSARRGAQGSSSEPSDSQSSGMASTQTDGQTTSGATGTASATVGPGTSSTKGNR